MKNEIIISSIGTTRLAEGTVMFVELQSVIMVNTIYAKTCVLYYIGGKYATKRVFQIRTNIAE